MRHTEGPATILEGDKDVGVQVDLHRDVAWIAHAHFSHLLRASGFRSRYGFLVLGLPSRDTVLPGEPLKTINNLMRRSYSSHLP